MCPRVWSSIYDDSVWASEQECVSLLFGVAGGAVCQGGYDCVQIACTAVNHKSNHVWADVHDP